MLVRFPGLHRGGGRTQPRECGTAGVAIAVAMLCGFPVLICGFAAAESPVGWRQDTSGVFPAASPPSEWTAESVLWKNAEAGGSNSSAISVGDRVFVCAEPTRMLCLAADDGRLLWEHSHNYDLVLSESAWQDAQLDLAQAETIRQGLNEIREQAGELDQQLQDKPDDAALKKRRDSLQAKIDAAERKLEPLEKYRIPERSAGCTTATPLCDGERVYAVFGTGIVVCYNLEGERQWIRLLDKPALDWGHTASPLLAGDSLLVHITALTALDTESGEVRWTADVLPSYGSPVACRFGTADAVLTAAGDGVGLADGVVLAERIAEPLQRSSPVVADGIAYFVEVTARAVRLPVDGSPGAMAETLWETKLHEDNYYASPLVREGLVYTVSEGRMLTVLDAASGAIVYEELLRFDERGAVVSSLAAAGEYVYVTNEAGATKVLRAGREYDEVAENPLAPLRGSLHFADGRLFVRTLEGVYCIGE